MGVRTGAVGEVQDSTLGHVWPRLNDGFGYGCTVRGADGRIGHALAPIASGARDAPVGSRAPLAIGARACPIRPSAPRTVHPYPNPSLSLGQTCPKVES